MSTLGPTELLYNSRNMVSSSSSEDRMGSALNRPSFLTRMAMRISRARWFSFLRRVFHYQNGSSSGSDLGSNPFNTKTWMMLEFVALMVQVTSATITLAISKSERPIWPMRIWIAGYDIGCVLNLLVLYGRYHQLYVTNHHGNAIGLSNMEHQGNNEETSTFLGYNMNMGSSSRGASYDQISHLSSWRYQKVHTQLEHGNDSQSSERLTHEDPECCICLAKYKDKEEVRQLPCSHLFHQKCVDQWLRIISCCPLCKQELQR
ncbi:hypothetical protein Lal_00021039 [Lupinus albus]|nr:hypothetical protein Lal_00021039 [Lupinus albus]